MPILSPLDAAVEEVLEAGAPAPAGFWAVEVALFELFAVSVLEQPIKIIAKTKQEIKRIVRIIG